MRALSLMTMRQAALEQSLSLSEWLVQHLSEHPTNLDEVARELNLVALASVQVHADALRFDLLPLAQALQHGVLPLEHEQTLYLVLVHPADFALRRWVSYLPRASRWQLALTLPGQVEAVLKQAETTERAMDQVIVGGDAEGDGAGEVEVISVATLAALTSPIVKLVNSTLFDAVQSHASDIHFECGSDGMVVKYRIDGVLQRVGRVGDNEAGEQAMSRIKVLAGLDITERRIPQDGRLQSLIQGRHIDFRVSMMPSLYGEDAVLRVLDRSQRGTVLNFATLGFDEHVTRSIMTLAQRPYGMVLVTGPTGSGKSTTLYAVLSELNRGDSKIISIEDPVEYELPGVLQIPVNEKKGLTFSRGLRSILRHDPDIILLGEIRDSETAGIAVQAALTGHLMFSTVHANGVFSVLDRLVYMKIEPSTLVDALNGVIAQRLLRKVCGHCRETAIPDAELTQLMGLSAEQCKTAHFARGRGCEQCRGSGYRGRLAVAEVLALNDAVWEGIMRHATPSQLRDIARPYGYRTLLEGALEAAMHGVTTLEEIRRVIAL